jgi:hypothetical protein
MAIAKLTQAVSLEQCIELLEARRLLLCDELQHYARPVAACDADFNALLVERTAIVQALAQLQPISRAEVGISSRREDHLTLTYPAH